MAVQFVEILVAIVLAIVSTLPVEQVIVSVEGLPTAASGNPSRAVDSISEQSSEEMRQQSGLDADGTESGVSFALDSTVLLIGRQVYLDNYCGVCHTLAAIEAGGMFGPTHDQIGVVALERIADPNYAGNAATAEEYIRESILIPSIHIAPGSMIAHQQMPPYTHLTEQEIDALVFFLVQQR